jgi:uncharacterized ion transporter superfamily protein YfcC|tara:strand:+ start:379 stop:756 length:378 start_codon:yes stop_codon:yes gene_type:complete
MWLKLLSMGIKTGAHLYQNKQKTKQLMSDAERLHAEKLANGELEYKKEIIASNDKGWKDEFVLILVSLPILLLVYSVFSDDPNIKTKIDLFFQYFKELPMWFQILFVSVVGAIYGIKGTELIKRK